MTKIEQRDVKRTYIDLFEELHNAIIKFYNELGVENAIIELNNILVSLKKEKK